MVFFMSKKLYFHVIDQQFYGAHDLIQTKLAIGYFADHDAALEHRYN